MALRQIKTIRFNSFAKRLTAESHFSIPPKVHGPFTNEALAGEALALIISISPSLNCNIRRSLSGRICEKSRKVTEITPYAMNFRFMNKEKIISRCKYEREY
jgi:hypothetical protein